MRAESAKAPGAYETIVGRFDRFPPLYYQMRLDRVTKELSADSGPPSLATLDRFDDAAVGCDRLHDDDRAIEWMARKAEAFAKMKAAGTPTGEHEYRSLANLGTFYAHRWVRSGADRSKLDDLKRSKDLIEAAIKLNPAAHFGRERYQLMAIEWILDPPAVTHESPFPTIYSKARSEAVEFFGHESPTEIGLDGLRGMELDDAEAGIRGLITLGDAWESIDIFIAYGSALEAKRDSILGQMAWFRARELSKAGKASLNPFISRAMIEDGGRLESHLLERHARLLSHFGAARKEAESWRAARNEFALARLKAGRHPDTDPDFWSGWVEPSTMATLPNVKYIFELGDVQEEVIIGGTTAAALAIGLFVVKRVRGRGKMVSPAAASSAESGERDPES